MLFSFGLHPARHSSHFSQQCIQIILNPDFETGPDLDKWTPSTISGSCDFSEIDAPSSITFGGTTFELTEIVSDTAVIVAPSTLPPLFTPNQCRLSQTVTFPGGLSSATLSWIGKATLEGGVQDIFNGANVVLFDFKMGGGGMSLIDEVFSTADFGDVGESSALCYYESDVTDALNYLAGATTGSVEFALDLTVGNTAMAAMIDNVALEICKDGGFPDDPPEGGNDPHFKTWKGEKYSYHGACDLVLLHSDVFANGLGLDIHIRTKHRRHFSYIASAAIRIGDEILEVSGHDYYLNGIANVELPNTIAGYTIHHKVVSDISQTYDIKLENGQHIYVKTWKDFVLVKIENGKFDSFHDSVGLMGSYVTGHKVSRDGQRIIEDDNEFGQEWQVQPEEPKLFQSLEAATLQCTLPVQNVQRRRLGEHTVSEEAAAKACAHVGVDDREFCIYDVIATNDVTMAGAY